MGMCALDWNLVASFQMLNRLIDLSSRFVLGSGGATLRIWSWDSEHFDVKRSSGQNLRSCDANHAVLLNNVEHIEVD